MNAHHSISCLVEVQCWLHYLATSLSFYFAAQISQSGWSNPLYPISRHMIFFPVGPAGINKYNPLRRRFHLGVCLLTGSHSVRERRPAIFLSVPNTVVIQSNASPITTSLSPTSKIFAPIPFGELTLVVSCNYCDTSLKILSWMLSSTFQPLFSRASRAMASTFPVIQSSFPVIFGSCWIAAEIADSVFASPAVQAR